MARKYYTKQEILEDKITLIGEEYQHLAIVMRAKINDEICLCNGDGNDYFSIVENITNNEIKLKIIEKKLSNTNSKVNLLVCVGLMKGDKNEFVIQKCAELGANKLIFFESEFCVAKDKHNKEERYKKISMEASKQSGRATIMEVLPTVNIKHLPKILKDYQLSLCAYEKGGESLKNIDLNSSENIALIIGSEGGFSEKEIELLKENANMKIITLGTRILRAETATIALTSVVMHLKGEI